VLLLLPVALLLEDLPRRMWIWLLTPYFLLTLPLWPAWSWAFPKVWLLVGLFLIAGYAEIKVIPLRTALLALTTCVLASAAVAISQRGTFVIHARQITLRRAIYSESPVASPSGLLYESIASDRYVIRRNDKTFAFDGDAFHPSVPDSGKPVYFELAHGGRSVIMRFDEQTGESAALPIDVPYPHEPAISHDGKNLAFISGGTLYTFDGHATRRIAAKAHDPSFMAGDQELVYAS
jgi:hypothetical protein